MPEFVVRKLLAACMLRKNVPGDSKEELDLVALHACRLALSLGSSLTAGTKTEDSVFSGEAGGGDSSLSTGAEILPSMPSRWVPVRDSRSAAEP